MKNAKKFSRFLAVFVLIITLLVFPFSGCIGKSVTLSFARNMQKNTNFEFCILTEITADISFEDYFIVPGFGVTGYVNKKYGEDYSSKEDINLNLADIISGNFDDSRLFKVEKGFFKNTYYAN